MVQAIYTGFVSPFIEREGKKRKYSLIGSDRAGVYIIKENGVVVYVGMSQKCVLKRCYRHFYKFSDAGVRHRSYYDLEAGNYEISIINTSPEDAVKVERGLILSIQPRDNRERYERYLAALVHEMQTQSIPVELLDEVQAQKNQEHLRMGVLCFECETDYWKRVHTNEDIYECCTCGSTSNIKIRSYGKEGKKQSRKPGSTENRHRDGSAGKPPPELPF
ncbi:MAG: GIY-YIG nuclease family protein [Gammaproteobacteria bacterium]|nr:GIY-YIG nuclease family protein [Gammaproteobacteria bacterium]